MQSTTDLYTIILKRALKYLNSDTKKQLANTIIREFMENHLNEEPLKLGYESIVKNDEVPVKI